MYVVFVVVDIVVFFYLNGELLVLRCFMGSVLVVMWDLNYIGVCSGGFCEVFVVFDEFRIWLDSWIEEEIWSYMYCELDISGLIDLVFYY